MADRNSWTLRKSLLKLKRRRIYRKFCKLNGYYCPDCIYHNYVWDGMIFRGNRCGHPYSKYDTR